MTIDEAIRELIQVANSDLNHALQMDWEQANRHRAALHLVLDEYLRLYSTIEPFLKAGQVLKGTR